MQSNLIERCKEMEKFCANSRALIPVRDLTEVFAEFVVALEEKAQQRNELCVPYVRDGHRVGEFVIDLEAFHRPVIHHLLNLERRIMTALEDSIAKAEAASAALIGKNDQLISLVGDLRTQIANGTLDPTAAIARIDAVTASMSAESDKDDAAINPPDSTPTP